jgi:hypothetical protein
MNIAWRYLWTAKDSWLGPSLELGSIGALYKLTSITPVSGRS